MYRYTGCEARRTAVFGGGGQSSFKRDFTAFPWRHACGTGEQLCM